MTRSTRQRVLRGILAALAVAPCAGISQEPNHEESTVEISISPNPFSEGLLENTRPVSALSRREIETRAQSTLGETIAHEPGVSSTFAGAGASRPVVRGFAGERVRVLRNGVTTGDVSDLSEDHVTVADPFDAQRIEILRGAETLRFGSSAIGGAVNVIDRAIPEEALAHRLSGEILSRAGDRADGERSLASRLEGNAGVFQWTLSGFSRDTDNYRIPSEAESQYLRDREGEAHVGDSPSGGRLENSSSSSWSTTLGGSYLWERGFAGLSFGAFESQYGVPVVHGDSRDHAYEHHEEHDGDPHDEPSDAHSEHEGHGGAVRIHAQQNRFDSRAQVNLNSGFFESLSYRVGLSSYEHTELEGGEAVNRFQRDELEGRVELAHHQRGRWDGSFGAQLRYDDLSARGDEAYFIPTTTISPALFLFEKLALSESQRLGSLSLGAGARVESVTLDPRGRSGAQFFPFSLSAGPVWELGDHGAYSIGLTAAFSERAPSAVELYADGAHYARQIFEVGDPELSTERSWGVDLVMRKNYRAVTGSLTPFVQQFTDFITLAPTGETRQGLDVSQYRPVDARFWGVEGVVSVDLNQLLERSSAHAFTLEGQVDLVRARNLSDSDDMPRIPPLRTIVRARYTYGERLNAMVESVFAESQRDTSPYELPTDGYTALSSELRVRPVLSRSLELFLRGTNLLDEEVRVHSSFLKDLAPLRGRALMVGVRVSL